MNDRQCFLRRGWVCWLLVGWIVLLSKPAWAERYGDVSVQIEPIPQMQSSGSGESLFGYLEFRIEITNHSLNKDHVVEVLLPKDAYRVNGATITNLRRVIRVPASSSALVCLYQPPVRIGGDELAVRIDGEIMDRRLSLPYTNHGGEYWGYYSGSGSEFPVLVSRSVGTEFRDWMESSSSGACCRSETPVSAWSTHWLGFSRYAGVVITAGDLRSMSMPTKQALRQYIECGGSLLVIGAATVPAEFMQTGATTAVASFPGFGHCLTTEDPQARSLHKTLPKMWNKTANPWRSRYSVEEANRHFPVIEEINIPVRGMLVLMIVFAIVVGPVSIWLLNRWKKRMWLLWVIPAISLITCGGVFVYAAFAEGWEGQSRTSVLTLLDENTNRATSIGWTAFYSPLTPSGGLTYGSDIELTPEIVGDYYRSGANRSLSINDTNGQHLESGWVAARVPTHFRVRKNELRRERLSVRRDDQGRLVVMNGLGADIQTLHVADEDGKVWAGETIPAGKEVTLELTKKNSRHANDMSIRNAFSSGWLGRIDEFKRRPQDYLKPNTYIAVMDACPFIEPGLENLKQQNNETVVYGLMKRER